LDGVAPTFNTPDKIDVVLHVYRHRLEAVVSGIPGSGNAPAC
jgi:hypothetical protein